MILDLTLQRYSGIVEKKKGERKNEKESIGNFHATRCADRL